MQQILFCVSSSLKTLSLLPCLSPFFSLPPSLSLSLSLSLSPLFSPSPSLLFLPLSLPLQEVEVTLPMKGKKGRAPGVKKPRIAPVAPHSTMTVLPPAVTTPSPLVSSQAVGSTTPAQLPGTQQQVIKVWHNNMWYLIMIM